MTCVLYGMFKDLDAVVWVHFRLRGLLSTVTDGAAVTRYGYDDAGRLTRTQHPNTTIEQRVYDNAGRLTGIRHRRRGHHRKVFDGWIAQLDPVSNPLRETRVHANHQRGRTRSYAYDANDRLVRVCFAASCRRHAHKAHVAFAYDAVGNRIREQQRGTTTTYSYDAADRLVKAHSPRSVTRFAYDADGNRTRSGKAALRR